MLAFGNAKEMFNPYLLDVGQPDYFASEECKPKRNGLTVDKDYMLSLFMCLDRHTRAERWCVISPRRSLLTDQKLSRGWCLDH